MATSSPAVPQLLLVDDDPLLSAEMAGNLERAGYGVTIAPTAAEAREQFRRRQWDLAVIDLVLQEESGIDLLQHVRDVAPECAVVMLSGRGSIPVAVDAMKRGAADFLTKPVRLAELNVVLQRALRHAQVERENQHLKQLLQRERWSARLLGGSRPMQELRRLISRVATSPQPVLILGESGTGKELVARAIHDASDRADAPFVPINCAALPETLLESELFGFEKGAFTGATAAKPGLFEAAEGGTLFVDELGELALPLQAKLLRVLEDGSFRRVGSIKERRAKVRVVAATNRFLAEEVKAGRFRDDLYYRINVLPLALPPLRERLDDLEELISFFLGADWSLADDVLPALRCYRWPGNVRQLRNSLERARVLADDHLIELKNFPPEVLAATEANGAASTSVNDLAGVSSAADLDGLTRQHVERVYEECQRNKAHAAKRLGISRRSLYRLLEKYDIPGQAASAE